MPANETTVADLIAELEREAAPMFAAIQNHAEMKDSEYWDNYHGAVDRRTSIYYIKQTLAALEARNGK